MANKIQLRRGTASAWTSANPVLSAGEIGYESDTHQFKIGDGSTVWSSLTYFAAGGGGGGTVASTDITDSTITGRAVLTAASGSAARTAIGAGTSSLALGTTSSTALAGNTTAAGIGGVTGTGITSIVAITQAAYDALGTKDTNTLYVIRG